MSARGTLYRYFPSKEDLYLGVVAEAFDLLIDRLERVEAEDLPAAVALSRMIEAIVETFARHLPFFRLMQQERRGCSSGRSRSCGRAATGSRTASAAFSSAEPRPGVFRKVDRDLGPFHADRARVGHDTQSRGRHPGGGSRAASRRSLPPRHPPASHGVPLMAFVRRYRVSLVLLVLLGVVTALVVGRLRDQQARAVPRANREIRWASSSRRAGPWT